MVLSINTLDTGTYTPKPTALGIERKLILVHAPTPTLQALNIFLSEIPTILNHVCSVDNMGIITKNHATLQAKIN